MRVEQVILKSVEEITTSPMGDLVACLPDFVLAFGDISFFNNTQLFPSLVERFPKSHLIGCSTAGEISNQGADDGSLVLTGVKFDNVVSKATYTSISDMTDSFHAGERIGQDLCSSNLKCIVLLGRGTEINGSALVEGVISKVGKDVLISGGLAGDNAKFEQTFTLSNDGISDKKVVALGLYGDALQTSYGSFGGWKAFGPARTVTKCNANILYELDGEPALNIYKRYLGEFAKDLPSSGLLFPFEIVDDPNQTDEGLIRTILGINETDGSLTLAGAVEAESTLRLMQASTEALIDGAENAANQARKKINLIENGLALLISCVGRKIVMGDFVDEEVEAVANVLDQGTTLAGFYSYGEINPSGGILDCKLHNQTMTIAYLSEL